MFFERKYQPKLNNTTRIRKQRYFLSRIKITIILRKYIAFMYLLVRGKEEECTEEIYGDSRMSFVHLHLRCLKRLFTIYYWVLLPLRMVNVIYLSVYIGTHCLYRKWRLFLLLKKLYKLSRADKTEICGA